MASGRLRLQHHPFLAQHLVHSLKDLLGDAVLFQQQTEVEDRGFIRDPVFDYFDTGETAEAGRIDQHLLNQWVREGERLLQQGNRSMISIGNGGRPHPWWPAGW